MQPASSAGAAAPAAAPMHAEIEWEIVDDDPVAAPAARAAAPFQASATGQIRTPIESEHSERRSR